ncbi:unnamed protein product [Meloidogyne enterolobii]|uniref:Uncharacterized protein n=1 Tax=Meloidogyne enterolobii TaxID=390850 RepID=A0ACB0XQ74_MELEN
MLKATTTWLKEYVQECLFCLRKGRKTGAPNISLVHLSNVFSQSLAEVGRNSQRCRKSGEPEIGTGQKVGT